MAKYTPEEEREYAARKHHAALSNIRDVVPSITGQHHKVSAGKKHEVAKKMKRGNYSIFKIEGDKHTRIKHNMSHAEMSEQLKNNPEYRGGEGYGFGGRRTYKK